MFASLRYGCDTLASGLCMIVILFFESSLLSEQTSEAQVAGFDLRHSTSLGAVPVYTIENGPSNLFAHTLCFECRTPILYLWCQ